MYGVEAENVPRFARMEGQDAAIAPRPNLPFVSMETRKT
jgi:hypothetical protein